MVAVGWLGLPSWGEEALDMVHRYSGGIPRRINRLCSRVLLGGALEQSRQLSAAMVEATAQELEDDLGGHQLVPALHYTGTASDTRAETEKLYERVAALERRIARYDRLYEELMDFIPEVGESRA
jgi:hypothetical protein